MNLGNEPDKLPAFFVNSFPKSGRHLLEQILLGIPGLKYHTANEFYEGFPGQLKDDFYRLAQVQQNEFVAGHVYYSAEWAYLLDRLRMKSLFLSRDLRDVVVSFAYFITEKDPKQPLHHYFTRRLTTQKQRYLALINGVEESDWPNIAEYFMRFEGWLNQPGLLSITFEELMTSQVSRRQAIVRIATYLWDGLTPSATLSQMVEVMEANIDPGTSVTFRKGEIGNWRQEFDEETKDAFKRRAGELLIRLGYETNDQW